MTAVKMKKIREMNEKELQGLLREMRLELSKDRAASEIGTAKNPGKLRATRKAIARILTVMKEKKTK